MADNLVDQLSMLTLGEKKKTLIAKKAAFTRHYGTLDRKLILWSEDIASPDYEKYAKEIMTKLRNAFKVAMTVYVEIQTDDMTAEEFAKIYQPKIDEIEKNQE